MEAQGGAQGARERLIPLEEAIPTALEDAETDPLIGILVWYWERYERRMESTRRTAESPAGETGLWKSC